LLPATTPAVGWIEYEMLGQLIAGDRVAMDTTTAPIHLQPVSWHAPVLSFHSGRMFAGSLLTDRSRRRRAELRRLRRDVPTMTSQTIAGRRRTNGGRIGGSFALCGAVVVLANALGQLVGIATRSVGNSAAILE
jgi:hypothetical protein